MLLWLESMARTLIGAPPNSRLFHEAFASRAKLQCPHNPCPPLVGWFHCSASPAGSQPQTSGVAKRTGSDQLVVTIYSLQGGDYSILSLDLCCSVPSQPHPWLSRVQTPLCIAAREEALASHPDRAFVRYSAGNSGGFPHQQSTPLQSASCSMHSVREHPDVIRSYLEKECALGHMLGPFPQSAHTALPPLHINLIPKGHNTGKWQLITDLSYPPGQSVNNGISSDLSSMLYIHHGGQGCRRGGNPRPACQDRRQVSLPACSGSPI